MSTILNDLVTKKIKGEVAGIPSFCTGNELVIEALLYWAKETKFPILIEATANQVNQFGGYTGMLPSEFKLYIEQKAEKIGVPVTQIILGGDHLGPIIWSDEPEDEAMAKAEVLVRMFVRAGFQKIHLDTSMKLISDFEDTALSVSVIARRGARLCKACEEEYQKLLKSNPRAPAPVYIIGSEVPIPGGVVNKEEKILVTKPSAVEATITAYMQAFRNHRISDAWNRVIAIVVQPGVEFGDDSIFYYSHENTKELCKYMKLQNLVMEGHSTDYQTVAHLREMVKDGIAILKVGPALTFTLREGLFALSMIEHELIPANKRSYFRETLEDAMLAEPEYWEKHYCGTYKDKQVKRKYSYSDRCRYYLTKPNVKEAIQKLFDNIDEEKPPLSLLKQYMPLQYQKVIAGKIQLNAKTLVIDHILDLVKEYYSAAY